MFVLLRAHTGHDFSLYKQSTIAPDRASHGRAPDRAWRSTCATCRIPARSRGALSGPADWRDALFRDPEAFARLRTRHPALLARRRTRPFRVWVAGCSTGEEAYSIAILLREHRRRTAHKRQVSPRTSIGAPSSARAPAYIRPISPRRVGRTPGAVLYTEAATARYRIKAGRDILVFSEQNVVRDPPFSRSTCSAAATCSSTWVPSCRRSFSRFLTMR